MKGTLTTLLTLAATVGLAQSFFTMTGNALERTGDVVESFWMQIPAGTKELVPSWRIWTPGGEKVHITLELIRGDECQTMVMADWSEQGPHNSSKNRQRGDLGRVSTDTVLLEPGVELVRFRITGAAHAHVHELYLTMAGDLPFDDHITTSSPAWGMTLEPPRRCQGSYPNGGVLCSPTTTSMLLSYWGKTIFQPRLEADVPDLLPAIWDQAYGGAGNWSFNASLAGAQPGMVGYVARLRGFADLEAWIEREVPVGVSVSYDLLRGADKKGKSDGHLVVLVGFTATGDPVFNDPGRGIVRMTYKRRDFERAWASSGRTAYLVYPKDWRVPEHGPWRTQ